MLRVESTVTVVELRTVLTTLLYPPTISGSFVGTPAFVIEKEDSAVPY